MNTATAQNLYDDPLLTTKEAAALMQMSFKTLEAWRLTGIHGDKLPYIKVGRSVRYRQSDIMQFLDASVRTHT